MGRSIDTIDLRLIEIESELFALDYHLNLIEEQIRNRDAFERMLSKKRIKNLRLTHDDPEWHYEQRELDYTVEFLVPKLFRSTFIVSLYAVYESAVTEIATLIKKKKGIAISINNLRGNFLDRAKKYFKDIIGFPLCNDRSAWQKINILFDLRHAIVHANGRIEMLNKSLKQKITNLEKQKVGISSMSGFIVIEESFLRETLSLVSASLNDLVERYKVWDDNHAIT